MELRHSERDVMKKVSMFAQCFRKKIRWHQNRAINMGLIIKVEGEQLHARDHS
jgi:hypothetical protein